MSKPNYLPVPVKVILIGMLASIPVAGLAAGGEPVLRTIKVKEKVEDDNEAYKARSSNTATKTDTPLLDIPQSISVIPAQLMNDLNVQNLADVVRYVPGIGMAQGEGNRETPILRGNTSTSDFFINGIRDDVQYYRDLYNIDRVEVLKGPNGMIFGRGGSGGVINRVTKVAGWNPVNELTLQLGSYDNKRVSVDVGQGINDTVAFRVNGVYEDSDSYRDDVYLKRKGINPTITINASERTKVTLDYEYFKDERIADRGISSFRGRPVDTDASTFFGDPERSPTYSDVNAFGVFVEHSFDNGLQLRNRTRYADYNKFYQNVFPGAVDATGTLVAISAYNNKTDRKNIFNQTDLLFDLETGSIKHRFVTGLELGRQVTDNFRETGYLGAAGTLTSVNVPLSNPRFTGPIAFRQSATDADNHSVAKVIGLYLQDQIEFTPQVQAVLGVRYDRFTTDFRNNRTGAEIDTKDNLISPRAGLIYKPIDSMSLYASYSKSYVPRAGEQLASLTPSNAALDPEEFTNYEVGVKWDPSSQLELSLALFDLRRSNVAVTDPNDSTKQILLNGDAQRSKGVELAVTGKITDAWSIIGGYTYQDAELTKTQTAALQKGSTIGQVPDTTISLWNRYDFTPMWGVGLGVIYRDDMLAATENKSNPSVDVNLDSYTRIDAAVFFKLNEQLRAQVNVENLFDRDYYLFANSNTNITPGSPRAVRLSMTASF